LNGVHDIGGMDGFGAIHRDPDEPVFHEPWEGRVFGMSLVRAGLPPITLDAGRHQLERLDPIQYLSSSYYERWLARIEHALIEAGTFTREEIEKRMQLLAAQPDLPSQHHEDAAQTDRIANVLRSGRPTSRKIRQKPRFAVGDRIRTRNLNPYGHTRLPRYARGKRGVIVAHHGAHVFPDSNAHGLGENPQHLYTVRIATSELWTGSAEPNESVRIDLWESYLEKDKADSKPSRSSRTSTTKKLAAETLAPSVKIRAGLGAAARGRRLAKPIRRSR
jgi:nitrile hydratase subunit beta